MWDYDWPRALGPRGPNAQNVDYVPGAKKYKRVKKNIGESKKISRKVKKIFLN